MSDRTKDICDRALLLVGFGGAFRRSELVVLDRTDAEFTTNGLLINIRRSKTNKFAAGRKIGVPYSEDAHRPVAALERWLRVAAIDEGPIFRRVDRHGNVLPVRHSPEAVGLIVKERTAAVELDSDTYSGHSLRAGFVTGAALNGVPSWKIREQAGHASDAMLSRYIRNNNLFWANTMPSV